MQQHLCDSALLCDTPLHNSRRAAETRRKLVVSLLVSCCSSALPSFCRAAEPHVVEELTFRVDAAEHDAFLDRDAATWTAALGEHPGFLAKETWLDAGRDEVKLVIRWRSKRDWHAVPQPLLQATDRRFRDAMGTTDWKMTSSRAYNVVVPANQADYVNIDALLTADRLRLAIVVEIAKDPVYFQAKRYLAVPIKEAIAALALRVAGDEIVFECVDDYASRMPLADFLAGDPWLAFRDLDAADGEAWIRRPKAPSPEKMGKAYVVWRNAKNPGKLTWPYAIERIRVVKKGR